MLVIVVFFGFCRRMLVVEVVNGCFLVWGVEVV